MKFSVFIIAFAFLLGWLPAAEGVAQSPSIEYQVEENQYAVVILQEGISPSEAKKRGKQRAAEITVQMGGRYFTIDSESQVQVLKPSGEWPQTQAFPQNLYQEKIIEGDFSKHRMEEQQALHPQEKLYPATKILFTIYSDKPPNRKAIDAYTLR